MKQTSPNTIPVEALGAVFYQRSLAGIVCILGACILLLKK